VSRRLGLVVVHKENFHCTLNFRNKIAWTYLVVFNFPVPWKFSKKLKKKKKKLGLSGRTPPMPDLRHQPSIFKKSRTSSNPIHLVFLSFSLHPNTFKEIFGQVSQGFKGFQLCFQDQTKVRRFFPIFQGFRNFRFFF
jgi:hypothetical protein